MIRDISSLVEGKRAEYELVAFGGLVIAGGEVAALGVAGERKLGSGIAVMPTDRWHLGSCGKAMTATVIARLVERGLLDWTTTVHDVFGSTIAMRQEYRDVTLTECLQHLAGLYEGTNASAGTERIWAAAAAAGPDIRAQRLSAARAILTEESQGTRGKYVYCNAGYNLAGTMAECVTGMVWEDVVSQELFAPLGMTSAGFGPPGTPGEIDEPWPHRTVGEGVAPVDASCEQADNLPWTTPMGRVHCSLLDWARFVLAHLRGGSGSGRYLSAESWFRLHTPPASSWYAMGWMTDRHEWAGPIWTHTGANAFNYAEIFVAPEKCFAVLQVRNECRPRGSDALLDVGLEIGKASP